MVLFGLPDTPLGIITYLLIQIPFEILFSFYFLSQVELVNRKSFCPVPVRPWAFIVSFSLLDFAGKCARFFYASTMLWVEIPGMLLWFLLFVYFFGKNLFRALCCYFIVNTIIVSWVCIVLFFIRDTPAMQHFGYAAVPQELPLFIFIWSILFLGSAFTQYFLSRKKLFLEFRWWQVALLIFLAYLVNDFCFKAITKVGQPATSIWILFTYHLFTLVFGYYLFYRTRMAALTHQKQQLLQLQHLHEIHYLTLQANSVAFIEMKQTLAHQLQEILRQASTGHVKNSQVEFFLAVYEKNMQLSFCQNPIVDGVLLSKQSDIAELGIDFHHDLQAMPAALPIESVHLSALFANMLDNAMQACHKLEERRWIRLSAGVKKGQLVVRCENSCPLENNIPLKCLRQSRKHGYGIQIMEEIAEKYHGILRVHSEDGCFSLGLLIPLETN